MSSIPAIVGLVAGAVHVLTGPDHLAAIAPLSLHQRSRLWLAGLKWGLGHSSGVLLVAAFAWLLRDLLPLESFSNKGERVVGAMLIAIGLWGLHKALRQRLSIHTHTHAHDGTEHAHIHIHETGASHDSPPSHIHTHAALAVGVLHGLAGSSHLLAIVPALALPKTQAATYLIAFALGTILSMAAVSTALGFLGLRSRSAGPKLYRSLIATCSLASLAVGGFWLIA